MGREFIDMFNEWADRYDDTVQGGDPEYLEVFHNYENLLQALADRISGNTLEFGVGTGNLFRRLIPQAKELYGIEPSVKMREIAQKRYPTHPICDGDFLDFPLPPFPIETLVSSYAFHHLTDVEKKEAFHTYHQILPVGGKILFADTTFQDERERGVKIKEAEENGFLQLKQDLETEYYTTLPFLKTTLEEQGFQVTFTPWNKFVWIFEAIKK